MLYSRQSQIPGALGLIALTTWFIWTCGGPAFRPINLQVQESALEYPLEHIQWLRDLYWHGVVDVENGSTVSYTKIELEAEEQRAFSPPLMQDVDITLPELYEINSAQAFDEPIFAGQRTTITVATSQKTPDASQLLFGIATLLHRVDASLDHFRHWAAGTGARFLILIDNTSTQEEIDKVLAKAEALNVNIEIVPSELEFNDRYTYLIKALHEKLDEKTRWISLIDDDTFFPSMPNLLALLGRYNTQESHYVGAYTEDLHQMGIWGIMAYGGAGVFLSVPLVEQLVPHYESCAAHDTTGDRRVAMCIFNHTTTRLSNEASLHQLDIAGDGSGFYEALRPQPVSVHHWKSWTEFPMDQVSLVAKMCGNDCIFQKYRLTNDWQLTNGISLIKYSHDRGPDDIRMEKTWNDSLGEDQEEMYLHSLAPIKPKDEGKISYTMEKSFYDHLNDMVRQLYVRREPDKKHVGVVEVIWRRKSTTSIQSLG